MLRDLTMEEVTGVLGPKQLCLKLLHARQESANLLRCNANGEQLPPLDPDARSFLIQLLLHIL